MEPDLFTITLLVTAFVSFLFVDHKLFDDTQKRFRPKAVPVDVTKHTAIDEYIITEHHHHNL